MAYHVSGLRPPLELAMLLGRRGKKLYDCESSDGGSLKKSVEYVVPYAMGNKVHNRDFDDVSAYKRWAADYPSFANLLPTVETGDGGRHIYARAEREQIESFGKAFIDYEDGELRLERCYCVAVAARLQR